MLIFTNTWLLMYTTVYQLLMSKAPDNDIMEQLL